MSSLPKQSNNPGPARLLVRRSALRVLPATLIAANQKRWRLRKLPVELLGREDTPHLRVLKSEPEGDDAVTPIASQRSPAWLPRAGWLLAVLFLALLVLMQSHALWESPTLLPDRWPKIFDPIIKLFPRDWILAGRRTPLGFMNAVLYVVIAGAMFAVYLRMVYRAFRGGMSEGASKRAFRRIFFFTLLFLAVLLVLPGMLSTDVFSYVWYGRIAGLEGNNPFIWVPSDYAWSDPHHWLQWVYWKNEPSVYGPVWVWMAAGIARVAQALGGDIVTHELGHRLLADGAFLLNVWLVWRVAGLVIARYWAPPARSGAGWQQSVRVAITLAYAWNPLLLVEFGGSGHNDVLMVTALLAALWLHLAGKWRLAVLAIAIGSLMKAITLVFLPGYLWLLFWETTRDGSPSARLLLSRLWKVVQGVGIAVAAWVVAYIPFWDGPRTLSAITGSAPASFYIHSLGEVIRYQVPELLQHLTQALHLKPASFWTAEAMGDRIDWGLRMSMLAITGVFAAIQTWRARDFGGMVWAWGWSLLAYLAIGAAWFWPWYVSWLVVPVTLIGPSRLFTAANILCVTSLASYAIFPKIIPQLDWVTKWNGLFIMGPPLIYLAATWWLERRRRPYIQTVRGRRRSLVWALSPRTDAERAEAP